MQRTTRQNKALHLYLDFVSKALNEAGYDVQRTLKKDMSIPWTMTLVKELMFKFLIKAMYDKDSTADLTTKELTEAGEVFAKHLAEKFGLSIDWPSLDTLLMQQRTNV